MTQKIIKKSLLIALLISQLPMHADDTNSRARLYWALGGTAIALAGTFGTLSVLGEKDYRAIETHNKQQNTSDARWTNYKQQMSKSNTQYYWNRLWIRPFGLQNAVEKQTTTGNFFQNYGRNKLGFTALAQGISQPVPPFTPQQPNTSSHGRLLGQPSSFATPQATHDLWKAYTINGNTVQVKTNPNGSLFIFNEKLTVRTSDGGTIYPPFNQQTNMVSWGRPKNQKQYLLIDPQNIINAANLSPKSVKFLDVLWKKDAHNNLYFYRAGNWINAENDPDMFRQLNIGNNRRGEIILGINGANPQTQVYGQQQPSQNPRDAFQGERVKKRFWSDTPQSVEPTQSSSTTWQTQQPQYGSAPIARPMQQYGQQPLVPLAPLPVQQQQPQAQSGYGQHSLSPLPQQNYFATTPQQTPVPTQEWRRCTTDKGGSFEISLVNGQYNTHLDKSGNTYLCIRDNNGNIYSVSFCQNTNQVLWESQWQKLNFHQQTPYPFQR